MGFQLSKKIALSFELRVDQNTGPCRVRDDLFNKGESTFRIVPADSISLRGREAFDLIIQVLLFFQKQSVPIGKQKLQVAQLGAIDRRIINLGKDAAPDREPDTTAAGMRSSDSVLGCARPTRLVSWTSERASVSAKMCHLRIPLCSADDGKKLVGLQTRAADQCAVHAITAKKCGGVVRFDAATVLYRDGFRRFLAK